MYLKIPKKKITKMVIIKTDCKKTLAQIISEQGCNYAINGGLYNMKTGKVNPIPLRIDSKTIATSSDGYWMFAWNVGYDFQMIHSRDMNKWKNAVACSAMLKDGSNTIFKYNPDQGGIRGRTALGDDAQNVHLVVTTDKKEPMSPTALRSKCKQNGMQNGIMLDSGGSSQLYYNGTYLQAEKRKVAYWICIWTDDVKMCPYQEPSVSVKKGSSGNSVKWIQWYLNEVAGENLKIDGICGNGTVYAIKRFQTAEKLTVDGIAGRKTRDRLKSLFEKKQDD